MSMIGVHIGTYLPNTYNRGFVMGWLFAGIAFLLWELIDLYATKIKLKKIEKELDELLEKENKIMENKEEIEVDVAGVEMQRREEILKSEHFVDIRIVVGEDYTEPVVQANVKGNPLMVATGIACLRDVEKNLVKRFPLVKFLAGMLEDNMSSKAIEVDDKEEKE